MNGIEAAILILLELEGFPSFAGTELYRFARTHGVSGKRELRIRIDFGRLLVVYK